MDARSPIREALEGDAPALAGLEAEIFSEPWSATAFQGAVRNMVALVAESEGELVGYVIGRAMAGEGEILNIAVAPGERRRGLGRALLRKAVEKLARAGARNVYLEVRESSVAAQKLYREQGFVPIGKRAGYYSAPPEDALVFRRCMDATTGPA